MLGEFKYKGYTFFATKCPNRPLFVVTTVDMPDDTGLGFYQHYGEQLDFKTREEAAQHIIDTYSRWAVDWHATSRKVTDGESKPN